MVSFSLRSTKSVSVVALAAAAMVAGSLSAHAQAPYVVVDASTGQVLLQDEATRPWNPASTTKMMTAFVALRAVKAGQAQMDSPLIASARAAGQKPSKLGIRPGQEITLDNALKVMMVKSANDLAVVIAEAIGGSVEGFASMMNAEARRLGMTESHFVNPHGFHAGGHQTSARDLALLSRALLTEFPEYQEYWGIGAVQVGNRVLNNTNGLIGRYPGVTGMKTGFVCASGFNLVSTATRGGRTLIVVVLGASSGGDRVVRSAQLLDQGFGTWSGQGQTLQTLPRSGYASAPDMRSQICTGRRRGVVLADDSDYGGAILSPTSGGGDAVSAAGSPLSFFSLPAQAQPSYSIGRSSGGGRPILGPRSGITPVAVYLGRAPGSTAVALGPGGRRVSPTAVATSGNGGIPASASALAPTGLRTTVPGLEPTQERSPALERPAAQAGIRPGGAQTARQQPPKAAAADDNAGAPMQLPGVINNGPRPGAAAGIRPRQTAATAPINPRKAATPAAKPPEQKRAAQAAPKAQPQKAPPKKKPAEADE